MKLAVPLSAPGEAAVLYEAGASEFYCGLQTTEWQEMYGNHDSISRRQGRANLPDFETLDKLIGETRNLNAPLFLTLNGNYTDRQLPIVLQTAEIFQEMGGAGIMVQDIALLVLLKKRGLKLIRGLSLLAAAGSCAAVDFYMELCVERIVFPRFMRPEQIGLITKKYPHIQAETIVWLDKCGFIDGFCRFLHTVGYRDCDMPGSELPENCVYAYDTNYRLPACFELLKIPPPLPACAACNIKELKQSGVSVFKLGGRGRPMDICLAGTRFLSAADNMDDTEEIKELYRRTFGSPCNEEVCYYGCQAGRGDTAL